MKRMVMAITKEWRQAGARALSSSLSVLDGQAARRRLLMALATFIAWLVRVRGDGAVDDSLEAGHCDLGDHNDADRRRERVRERHVHLREDVPPAVLEERDEDGEQVEQREELCAEDASGVCQPPARLQQIPLEGPHAGGHHQALEACRQAELQRLDVEPLGVCVDLRLVGDERERGDADQCDNEPPNRRLLQEAKQLLAPAPEAELFALMRLVQEGEGGAHQDADEGDDDPHQLRCGQAPTERPAAWGAVVAECDDPVREHVDRMAYEVGGGDERASRLGRLSRREGDEHRVGGAVGEEVRDGHAEEDGRGERQSERRKDGEQEGAAPEHAPAEDHVWLAVQAADRHRVAEHAVRKLEAPRKVDKGGDRRARVWLAMDYVEAVRQQRLRQEPIDHADARVVAVDGNLRQRPHVGRSFENGGLHIQQRHSQRLLFRRPARRRRAWVEPRLGSHEEAIAGGVGTLLVRSQPLAKPWRAVVLWVELQH
mmetsp:Transcript_8352/g.26096  ORF Transcript_8352/g.26096 Transcript_8352/m.26096 type:complete len:486 (+) Transcript_8352:645-2102(+)